MQINEEDRLNTQTSDSDLVVSVPEIEERWKKPAPGEACNPEGEDHWCYGPGETVVTDAGENVLVGTKYLVGFRCFSVCLIK